jgi:hypothetical protein
VNNSVPASYFIDLYRREADPWNFAQSAYEREKYERTIAALPRSRYRSALELAWRFSCGVLPQAYPLGRFDLTTVCEVGFYLCAEELLELRERVVAGLERGGHVVLVHWTPRVDGHATTTEEVHACFAASPQLAHLTGFSEQTCRLDLFEKRSADRPRR